MSDERGQALIAAVFILALAASVIAGLRVAQDRVFAIAGEHRAGEAAAEAAAAVIADAYINELRRVAASTASPKPTADVASTVMATGARDAAHVAANELSRLNGGSDIDELDVRCGETAVVIALRMSGVSYRAGFAVPCSRR